jgi:hypothetical protein
VWRYPEKFPPAKGPSSVVLQPGKAKPGGAQLGTLEVSVRNAAGNPVPGIAVSAAAAFSKKERAHQDGATDAEGRFVLQGSHAREVTLLFSWDGAAKRIEATFSPSGEGFALASARYKRIIDGQSEGSCANLFTYTPAQGTTPHRLDFRLPASLLECEEVSYGAERKVGEIAQVANIGGRDVNLGDKNMFSVDDERKLGFEASSQFDKQFQKIDDPQIVGYVERLMKKIAQASDVPNMPVNLRVVHTNDVNAFVTAGGHVYVFTGLIKAAENESQLVGVLAHEGSHAVARHVTEGATRSTKAQTGASIGSAALGALLGLKGNNQALLEQGANQAAGVITMRYDRRAETEADLLGAQYLWNAGWDPEGIARFFERLEKQGGGSSGPAWMSTHPTHEKRIQNGILWARAFLPPKERYLVDTAEFQAVKERVAKLPAPKQSAAPEGQKSLQQLMAESSTWKNVMAGAEAASSK